MCTNVRAWGCCRPVIADAGAEGGSAAGAPVMALKGVWPYWMRPEERPQRNDVVLSGMALLTGPNMGGGIKCTQPLDQDQVVS